MSKDANAESRNIDKLIRSLILKSYLNHNMISYEAIMFFPHQSLKIFTSRVLSSDPIFFLLGFLPIVN